MSPKSSDERYQEWLERMEIPLENQVDIDRFRDYLRDEFDITKDTQVQALWSAVDTTKDLSEHGIHPLIVHYPWGDELRFGVQGLPGLWGWEAVLQILEEEE